MNLRTHRRQRQVLMAKAVRWGHLLSECEFRKITLSDHFSDLDDYDEHANCTRCGGSGRIESDDPFWDDADEFNEIACWACSGTGDREHQTIF